MAETKNNTAECPYCKYRWTYKDKVLGYMVKPRSRTRCPNCKTYIEPSTKTIIYEYIALILLLIAIIFVVPNLPILNMTRIIIIISLLLIYALLFIPASLRFEKIKYNIKDKSHEKRN